MSINGVLSNAVSGLNAAQVGISTTSNNISNVDTPGYARQDVQFAPRTSANGVDGVEVATVRRITDNYLTNASREANAEAGEAEARADILDRAQAPFGDPSGGFSVFDSIDGLYESFGDLSADPTSSSRRNTAVADVERVFNELDGVSGELASLRGEADGRIDDTVDTINSLLSTIPDYSDMIRRDRAAGVDNSSAEDQLANVLDELSQYLDIRVVQKSDGAVEVRTEDGLLLSGRQAATLSYQPKGSAAFSTTYDPITVQYPGTPAVELDDRLQSGELRGLIDVRDQDLPELGAQVGELSAMIADSLNAEHNNNVSMPAPDTLTGENTGLMGTDALRFSGQATVSNLGADGTLNSTVEIDFDAGEMRVNGATTPAATFTAGGAGTIDEFVAAYNGLGQGVMTYADGVLSVDAAGGSGVAITQSETTPSDRDGRGFSHFFGLNNLVSSDNPTSFKTGLTGADDHGFTVGSQLELQLKDERGGNLATVDITIPAGSMDDILDELNATGTGLGSFGTFALDDAGELTFQPNNSYADAQLTVRDDNSQRGTTGLSFSTFFGLDNGARSGRATDLEVNPQIASNTNNLALGRLDLDDASFAVGNVVTGSGDASGAQALQLAGTTPRETSTAGSIGALTTTPQDYAGRVASDAGQRAQSAERDFEAADNLRVTANERRASVEGVNIDEELVLLNKYQEQYNAAAQLIQAAQEMSDTLLSIV